MNIWINQSWHFLQYLTFFYLFKVGWRPGIDLLFWSSIISHVIVILQECFIAIWIVPAFVVCFRGGYVSVVFEVVPWFPDEVMQNEKAYCWDETNCMHSHGKYEERVFPYFCESSSPCEIEELLQKYEHAVDWLNIDDNLWEGNPIGRRQLCLDTWNKGDKAKDKGGDWPQFLTNWRIGLQKDENAEQRQHESWDEDCCPCVSWDFVKRNNKVSVLEIFYFCASFWFFISLTVLDLKRFIYSVFGWWEVMRNSMFGQLMMWFLCFLSSLFHLFSLLGKGRIGVGLFFKEKILKLLNNFHVRGFIRRVVV